MTGKTWKRRKAAAFARLCKASPVLADRSRSMSVQALVSIVAMSEIMLRAHLKDGHLEATLHAVPLPADDIFADHLLEMVTHAVTNHVRQPRPESDAAFGRWLDGYGFTDVLVDLISRGAEESQLSAVADLVAGCVKALAGSVATLRTHHLETVLARDLPDACFLKHQLTHVAAWLLAPETSGMPRRAEILKRRLQAMQIYGALSASLCEPEITRIIDNGEPLAPALRARHDLTAAELRAVQGSRCLSDAIERPTDYRTALEELKAHEVPLRDWPGGGRRDQPEAWRGSAWHQAPRLNLIRPDYVGAQAEGVIDAMNALRDDLLRPLAAERLRIGKFDRTRSVEAFSRSLELNGAKGGGPVRRRFMVALRAAIVGPRGPKAFRKAVGVWHRRAATLAAVRHEKRAERPGWPPLCAPWTSACGRFEIVPLTSAADLVVEGRQLDHCVGGYYDICRRGDTQILSLRERGKRVATVEILLEGEVEAPSLRVGQFQSRRNTAPKQHLHDILRVFLRALRNGAHPMNAARVARYRTRMRRTWDGTWRSDTFPIEHAREAFPFYLPLLPRGTPDRFDDWAVKSGLADAIDLAFHDLATSPGTGIDDHVPY